MPLTADRNTLARTGDNRRSLVGAATRIFAGALLMRNATGHLVRGAVAVNAVGVGRAEEAVDNTLGAAGAASVTWRPGIFLFRNASAGDLITIADIGRICFILDDDQVARTDGTATRSRAGLIEDVVPQGVWVRLDESLTRAA